MQALAAASLLGLHWVNRSIICRKISPSRSLSFCWMEADRSFFRKLMLKSLAWLWWMLWPLKKTMGSAES